MGPEGIDIVYNVNPACFLLFITLSLLSGKALDPLHSMIKFSKILI